MILASRLGYDPASLLERGFRPSGPKTLNFLNKEFRPFFLGGNSIWNFPLFLPLAITGFGGPEGYSSLAERLFSGNSARQPLVFVKSLIFTNAPCKPTCLYSAPSLHTVDFCSHSDLRVHATGSYSAKGHVPALQCPYRRLLRSTSC